MEVGVRTYVAVILVALALSFVEALEVDNAGPSPRAINTFRLAQVNQERQDAVAQSLRGRDGDHSRESDEGHNHSHGGSHGENDSSEFHDSPWMPLSVIAGCIIVAGVAFVGVQRYRRKQVEKMLYRNRMSPSAPTIIVSSPRSAAPVVTVVPSHEPRKNANMIPGQEEPRPKDYNDSEPAPFNHLSVNPALHYVEEAPPSYFDIAQPGVNNPNSGRQDWMLETVSVPKPSVDGEYKRY